MDYLSNCPSLVEILSYQCPSDVITCMRINKRIHSVLRNNWRRMQKQKVDMEMTKLEDSCFRLQIAKNDPRQQRIQSATLGRSRAMLFTSGRSLCDFLEYLQPMVRISRFTVSHVDEYSVQESKDICECLRDVYKDDIQQICCGREAHPFFFRIHTSMAKDKWFRFDINDFNETHLNTILECSGTSTNRILVKTNNMWCADLIQHLLQSWAGNQLYCREYRQKIPPGNDQRHKNELIKFYNLFDIDIGRFRRHFQILCARPMDNERMLFEFKMPWISLKQLKFYPMV